MSKTYFSDMVDKYGIITGDTNKLVPNLMNKDEYVLLRLIFSCMSQEMKLSGVNKMFEFKQPKWLKK